MTSKTTTSWLFSVTTLLLLTLALSGNVLADSTQELMTGKASSEEQAQGEGKNTETANVEDQAAETAKTAIVVEATSEMTATKPTADKAKAIPKKKEKPKAVSTKDLAIPQDELKLFLKPFSTDELKIEADAWFKVLQKKAKEVTATELELVRLNKKQRKIEESIELLTPPPPTDGEAKIEKPKDPNDPHSLNATERLNYVKKALLALEPSMDADALESKYDANRALEELNTTLDAKKDELVDKISKLIEQRSSYVDRLNIVLDSINATDGVKEDGTDNDAVVPLRRYISTVTGLHVDTNDAKSVIKTIKKWMFSKKGGIRWLKNIGLFLGVLFGFWILSGILGAIVNRIIKASGNTSELLHNFLVGLVKKVTMLVGVMISLSALEINISPLLAALGAAGFILAFALQGTISNFASGLLMLLYRPFDIGDSIEGGGVKGIVESMSLVSTYIKTPDNQCIVVPNNAIWGGAITNSTSASTRRVDLSFMVSHEDNADHVTKLLTDIVKRQPLVLADPAFSVGLDELTDTGMNFSIKPWVNKADYGIVKSAIIHEVKRLFDNKEIHMPS